MVTTLQSHSIAIFGGHPNWKKKIKNVLPTVVFVDVDDLSKNISFIHQISHVFVNTSVFNHSFYRKLMHQIHKSEAQLYYLDGKSNMERVIQDMYQSICKK